MLRTRERVQRKEAAPSPPTSAALAAQPDQARDDQAASAPQPAPAIPSGFSFSQMSVTSQPSATAVLPAPSEQPLSDMQPEIPGGFVPESIVNDLTRAIDQTDWTAEPSEAPGYMFAMAPPRVVRKIDAALVMRVLDNHTAKEMATVRALYDTKQNRAGALNADLFGGGTSNIPGSLTRDQEARITALLQGTRPEPGGATTSARIESDVIELHELLGGSLNDDKIERTMALHRRPVSDIGRLDAYYQGFYGTSLPDLLHDKLKDLQATRMIELRMGDWAKADACAIEHKRQAIAKLDKKFLLFPGDLEERDEQRKKLVAGIETIVEQNRQEATADAASSGKTVAQATTERVGAVLETRIGEGGASLAEGLKETLKTKGEAIVALGNGSLVEEAAYRLLDMEKADSTDADKIAPLLRAFHAQAEQDIMAAMYGTRWSQEEKEAIAGDPKLLRRLIETHAKQYTNKFVETYDGLPGEHRSWAEIVASRYDYNRDLLNALVQGGGKADDLVELDVAIRKKDGNAIKAILQRQPNKTAIDDLSARYESKRGVSLRTALFGALGADAATTTSELLLDVSQSIMSGRSAAAAEEALDKPAKFGGDDEVNWIVKHGLRERNVTEANSGAMGSLREIGDDPETQVLMNQTAGRLRELQREWNSNDPWGRSKSEILAEMRRIRSTLTGDATAYEEDNARMVAELRSAVSFAVQIALAVALPGFPSSFLATMALNIGANVASNMVIWGEQYSLTSFRNDVLGGVLGGVGGRFGEEFAGAIASRVAGTAAKGTIEAAEQIGVSVGLAKQAGAAASMAEEASLLVKAAQQGGNLMGSTGGVTIATGDNQYTGEGLGQGLLMNLLGGLRGGHQAPAGAGGEPPHLTSDGRGGTPGGGGGGGGVTGGGGEPSGPWQQLDLPHTATPGSDLRPITEPLKLHPIAGTDAIPQGLAPGSIGTYKRQVVPAPEAALLSNPPGTRGARDTGGRVPKGPEAAGVYFEHQTAASAAHEVLPNHELHGPQGQRRGGQDTKEALVISLPESVKAPKDAADRALLAEIQQRKAAGEDVSSIEVITESTRITQGAIAESGAQVPPHQVSRNFLAEIGQFFSARFGYQEVQPGSPLPEGHPLRDMTDAEMNAFLDRTFDPFIEPPDPSTPPRTPPDSQPPDSPPPASPGQAPQESAQQSLDFRAKSDPDRPENKSFLNQSIDDALGALESLGAGHETKAPTEYYVFEVHVAKLPEGEGAPAPEKPAPGQIIPPESLRNTYGMPEANQRAFQEVARRHNVEIDMRPTVKEAAPLLEQGALAKHEDLHSKTINEDDVPLGARREDIGKVGFFKPQLPERPSIMDFEKTMNWNRVVERFRQRDGEYWDNARRMTELQRQADAQVAKQDGMDQRGTHQEYQIVIGEDGVVRAVLNTGGSLAEAPFTGDHDVFDIRNADGTPLSEEKYQAIVEEMKAAQMGVTHGAHMRWTPKTPADREIFRTIVDKHSSGGEVLIRFSPNAPPITAAPK